MVKHNKAKIIWTLFTVLFALYLFSNSVYQKQQSFRQSTLVLEYMKAFFANAGISISISEGFLRKLAHFIEYFLFGSILSVTMHIYVKSLRRYFFPQLFTLLVIPVIDEYIQIYSGRTSSVTDIILDFLSGLAGMGICLLFLRVIHCIRAHIKAGGKTHKKSGFRQ
ncbi:MAG TPA: VanZ family protein [Caproiciproducens sp.]|nr:VanZ family protein [Caproiciproducens sp.]